MKYVLVVMLNRTGMTDYTNEIITRLPPDNFFLLYSKYSNINFDVKNKQAITTFNSRLSFVLNSFFILPSHLLSTALNIRKYSCLYSPGGSIWTFFFMILFKLFGKPVVYTVHDNINHLGESRLNKYLNNLCIKISTNCIFLSEYVYNDLKSHLSKKKKIIIIPHGIIPVEGIDIENKLKNIPTGKILFLGRISRYKGVELLTECIARRPNYKLIVAGKSNYNISIRSCPNITFTDKYLDSFEISELLNWADILVLPYLESSQSGIVTLGISSQTPMVCTRVGGLATQLNDDECIFVNPNPEELLVAIDKLMLDVGRYKLIQRNLGIKKKHISWDEIASTTFNFVSSQ